MKKIFSFAFLFFCLILTIQAQDYNEFTTKGSISIRSNVIPWMILMPNIGVEYKTSDKVGLLLDGGWMRWHVNSKNRYWRMWNISPKARYYMGQAKNNYIGAEGTIGEYNFTGYQGRYMGAGLSMGHQFYAGKNLLVDLGFSLGYLYLWDKQKYNRIDGKDYRDGAKTSNGYWGPTSFSMTLVWTIN